MIPGNKINNPFADSKVSHNLSQSDFQAIAEALVQLKSSGIKSFSSLETYLNWYKNIYGQLALEMLLEDCKKALKEKDYKRLMSIVGFLAAKCNEKIAPEIRNTQSSQLIEEDQIIVAVEPESVTSETVELVLEEYEKYFDELDVDAIVREEMTLDEEGFISFAEISLVVETLETKLQELVESGEISQEEATVLLEKVTSMEIGQFAAINVQEIKEFVIEVREMDAAAVEKAVEDLSIRENIQTLEKSELFGEEGFMNFGKHSSFRADEATLTFEEFAQMLDANEKQIENLVEQGLITRDQADQIISKIETAPIDQAVPVQEVAQQITDNSLFVSPAETKSTVDAFVKADTVEIANQGVEAVGAENISMEAQTLDQPEVDVQVVKQDLGSDFTDIPDPVIEIRADDPIEQTVISDVPSVSDSIDAPEVATIATEPTVISEPTVTVPVQNDVVISEQTIADVPVVAQVAAEVATVDVSVADAIIAESPVRDMPVSPVVETDVPFVDSSAVDVPVVDVPAIDSTAKMPDITSSPVNFTTKEVSASTTRIGEPAITPQYEGPRNTVEPISGYNKEVRSVDLDSMGLNERVRVKQEQLQRQEMEQKQKDEERYRQQQFEQPLLERTEQETLYDRPNQDQKLELGMKCPRTGGFCYSDGNCATCGDPNIARVHAAEMAPGVTVPVTGPVTFDSPVATGPVTFTPPGRGLA